jgi:hypothetical protein
MAKASLRHDYAILEGEIIDTLIAGHKQWRPDLSYPESHSDMQGAVCGLLRMFEVKRRALPFAILLKDEPCGAPGCPYCAPVREAQGIGSPE